ncbi:MAG: MBL fold metallo-hydrolase [Candidatus Eiseniibacteriota bacterium]
MRVTVLGCGGSFGVPTMVGGWGVCDPSNPKNRRRRVSILVEEGGTTLLVDTGPDLREQLIDAGVGHLDAVLYTHAHADHSHGLNDLRALAYRAGTPVEIYADTLTLNDLKTSFGYAFQQDAAQLYRPIVREHLIEGPFRVGAVAVAPFEQDHGFGYKTLGFRFGPMAYSTDVVELDEAAFEALKGIDVWIVDCLRYEPHPTHAHFERTMDWIARVKPKRAVLTHMNQALDYEELRKRCPPGVEPGYDGLVIDL